MTRNEIAALFERRLDATTRLDAALLASLHSMDGIVESPFVGGVVQGRAAIEQAYTTFFRAFADLRIWQQDLLIDGDRAGILVRMDGTNHGGLMGLPPTERSFSLSMASLCEFRDGLIARERRIYDFTGLLTQIGAVKVKPA